MRPINLAEPFINSKIEQKVIEVLRSGRYINGEQNKKFEEEFAKYCDRRYAITVNSGTSALILLTKFFNLKKGDEVIVPSHTFISTVQPIILAGAKPVFAEIDEETYTIDPKDIEQKITNKTRAIIPVHLYGHPANMEKINKIAEGKLHVFIDACQAHGVSYKNIEYDSCDITFYSFFPSKNMSVLGDGGMITTLDERIAEGIKSLRDKGRRDNNKYKFDSIGYNFRLSEIHACIGREQLKHLDEWNNMRRENAKLYNKLLKNVDGVITPIEKSWAKHVYHQYVIRVKDRAELRGFLRGNLIQTGIHYPIPCHKQPCIVNMNEFIPYKKLPVTEKICDEILSLPMHPFLLTTEIEYICEKIKKFMERIE